MSETTIRNRHRAARLVLVALLGVTTVSAASAQDRSRGTIREDRRTCDSFSAPQGSRGHAQCMLAQQRRRDNAPLRAAEQQMINADVARNNLEMVRRIRCDREAKRAIDRGERPQRC